MESKIEIVRAQSNQLLIANWLLQKATSQIK